jgi:hypothetical protein
MKIKKEDLNQLGVFPGATVLESFEGRVECFDEYNIVLRSTVERGGKFEKAWLPKSALPEEQLVDIDIGDIIRVISYDDKRAGKKLHAAITKKTGRTLDYAQFRRVLDLLELGDIPCPFVDKECPSESPDACEKCLFTFIITGS